MFVQGNYKWIELSTIQILQLAEPVAIHYGIDNGFLHMLHFMVIGKQQIIAGAVNALSTTGKSASSHLE